MESESVLNCEKWERNDIRNITSWNGQYDTEHLETEHLRHFQSICEANGVATIWRACQRWPRLLSTTVHSGVYTCLFPQATLEQNQETYNAVYGKYESDWASSQAMLTTALGFPDDVLALIMVFARDPPKFKDWTNKLTIRAYHAHELTAKVGEDEGQGDAGDEGDEDEELNTEKHFPQPCIHTPIWHWVGMYDEAARVMYADDETTIHNENFYIRALLHGLLEAMGKYTALFPPLFSCSPLLLL
jgi:hypothetical protein